MGRALAEHGFPRRHPDPLRSAGAGPSYELRRARTATLTGVILATRAGPGQVQLPTDRVFGLIAAVGPGADGSVEVPSQLGVYGADAGDGLADAAGDRLAHPFGRGSGPALAVAEPGHRAQLAQQRLPFELQALGSGEVVAVFGLGQLVGQVDQPPAVGGDRPAVGQRAELGLYDLGGGQFGHVGCAPGRASSTARSCRPFTSRTRAARPANSSSHSSPSQRRPPCSTRWAGGSTTPAPGSSESDGSTSGSWVPEVAAAGVAATEAGSLRRAGGSSAQSGRLAAVV